MSITSVFEAPFEELHEKYGVGLQLQVFSGVSRSGVFGARHIQQGIREAELEKLKWSSPKHALTKI
jgi:hypothetical protein